VKKNPVESRNCKGDHTTGM